MHSNNNYFTIADNSLKRPLDQDIYTLTSAAGGKNPLPSLSEVDDEKSLGTTNFTRKSVSEEIEEILNMTHETNNIQPRPRLPMNMVVSKSATRKPILAEHPEQKIDLSLYRQYKLASPPWRNLVKPNRTRRSQPSKFKKMAESMKEKSAEFKFMDNYKNSSICTKETTHSNFFNTVYSEQTQTFTNAFNSKTNYKKKNHKLNVLDEEDPLSFNLTEGSELLDKSCISTQNGHQTQFQQNQPLTINIDNEEAVKFEFNPIYTKMPKHQPESEDKFVWNPVLVLNETKQPLYPVHNPDGVYLDSPLPLSPQVKDFSYYKQPTCFDSPCSLSSTSSGNTIAEERLRVTYFTKRQKGTSHSSSHRCNQPCPEPNLRDFLWLNRPSENLTYLEE